MRSSSRIGLVSAVAVGCSVAEPSCAAPLRAEATARLRDLELEAVLGRRVCFLPVLRELVWVPDWVQHGVLRPEFRSDAAPPGDLFPRLDK